MPRPNKPWFWAARGEWCVKINKVRHRLGPDKEEAFRRFHELMMERPSKPIRAGAILEIAEAFMDWTQLHRAPRTYDFYKERIERFLKAVPNMQVTEIKPYHAQQWLDSYKDWSDGYKAGVVTSLKRMFNWAVKQGYIDRNPLNGLEKPDAPPRDQLISPQLFEEILSHVPNHNFHDIARFVWFTGCRPEEAVIIEPRHYDAEHKRIVLPKNEAKGRKRARIIYLPDEALEIVQRNLNNTPIFLNTKGRPWTAYAINCTFERVKKKMGVRFCMYALRHSFGNQSITKAGLSLEETAIAMGHRDTTMIYKVYGHLVDSPDHMQKLVNKSARARNGDS